ncbi:hypothetical protein PFISCL1PPCAC_24287 [Pristionchus fissidentatus]|uniref:Exostosin GT47 domain-containing protein n=1 Tax=Pristionchus fissidentatus TaxID=1538716 RepID=A0AAV5WMZ3_9BILA|nr:hypothetical protein PFISCL1PPCAC_24287 [Pristionchus fissidentatus]
MKTRWRYALLVSAILIYGGMMMKGREWMRGGREEGRPSAFDEMDDTPVPNVQRKIGDSRCSMASCFDFTKCEADRLKVYVYPDAVRTEGEQTSSEAYTKIVQSIRESPFYTSNASEACLFVLSIDTTDRDKISENYVRDVSALISSLPSEIWNGGTNHVIFNLYHGTFPDYAAEHLGFDTGRAIVARASASAQNFRHGFDVSFPLFHKEHPIRDSIERAFTLRDRDPILVSFKGKRYVYGIGSETRDSLHHLHNPERTPMLTTCRHNNDWQAHQDERCERDNEEYDRWDYETLMVNSTFCLTPRGRRLGSFRFLESLRAGCIPIVLSDDWKLPFDEFIDWPAAAVRVPEKNVLLVNDIASSFSPSKILKMKQRGRLLYHRYFASVEKIAMATLELIWSRLNLNRFSPLSNQLLPFETTFKSSSPRPIVVVISTGDRLNSRLQRAIETIGKVQGVREIIILWPSTRGSPPIGADMGMNGVEITIVETENQSDLPLEEIGRLIEKKNELRGSAVLFYSDRSSESEKEISHLLSVFSQLPHTLVSNHGIEYSVNGASHSSTFANVALLHTAVVHSGYLSFLPLFLPSSLISSCPSASLSTLISSLSLSPPSIVVGHRLEQQWNLINLTDCLNLISKRYPLGIPLVANNVVFQ